MPVLALAAGPLVAAVAAPSIDPAELVFRALFPESKADTLGFRALASDALAAGGTGGFAALPVAVPAPRTSPNVSAEISDDGFLPEVPPVGAEASVVADDGDATDATPARLLPTAPSAATGEAVAAARAAAAAAAGSQYSGSSARADALPRSSGGANSGSSPVMTPTLATSAMPRSNAASVVKGPRPNTTNAGPSSVTLVCATCVPGGAAPVGGTAGAPAARAPRTYDSTSMPPSLTRNRKVPTGNPCRSFSASGRASVP